MAVAPGIIDPMLWWTAAAFAGLGPAGVVVVFNGDVPEAAEVAEAYAAARSLPPGHLCPIRGLDASTVEIPYDQFVTTVRDPLDACLDALPQPDEIDALVTVRGLPYLVTLDGYVVGFEALLQVGHGTGPVGDEIAGMPQRLDPIGSYVASVPNPEFVGIGSYCASSDLALTNPYGSWYRGTCALQDDPKLPRAFRRSARRSYGGYDLSDELFVVTRLDGFDFDDARALVERGVEADGAFPTAPFLCMHGADDPRGARDPECELATRRLAEAGHPTEWVGAFDGALSGRPVSAYFTGADDLRGAIDGLEYAPGAIVDNLTSYGAVPQNFFCDETGATCPQSELQTSIARFVRAGATGVHGAVAEPLNNVFPDAGAMVLYASGYSLGESFLFNQEFLYWQNLVLGDPLATPFAERPVVSVPAEVPADLPLALSASHPDGVTEVRLYVDGVRVADAEGDVLSWEHGLHEGDTIEVLAVAVGGDRDLERPGWPVDIQTARPAVQGWTRATVTVGPGSDLDTGGEPLAAGECGCGGTTGSSAMALLLAGAAARRARLW